MIIHGLLIDFIDQIPCMSDLELKLLAEAVLFIQREREARKLIETKPKLEAVG